MAKVVYPGDSCPIIMPATTIEIRHMPWHRDGRAIIAEDNKLYDEEDV